LIGIDNATLYRHLLTPRDKKNYSKNRFKNAIKYLKTNAQKYLGLCLEPLLAHLNLATKFSFYFILELA